MLFDTASLMFELEPAEETLAHDMMHYLGNFAWSQDPSRDNRGYVVRTEENVQKTPLFAYLVLSLSVARGLEPLHHPERPGPPPADAGVLHGLGLPKDRLRLLGYHRL